MKEKKKKILVIDDDKQRNQSWREDIQGGMGTLSQQYEVVVEDVENITNALGGLHERRANAREQYQSNNENEVTENLFDSIDILFVDYDLFDLDKRTDVTGELISYLARCFSYCGFIVAVNQFENSRSTFDLNLTGHPEAFADLHLAPDDLKSKGLWSEPWTEFRPWHWPLLHHAHEKFQKRVAKLLVNENLDKPILSFLNLEDHFTLSIKALEFLGDKRDIGKVTFKEFVTHKGLRNKDKPWSDEAVARIAAARIAKWLETLVLPAQSVLVDAPHLVQRFPSLIDNSDNLDEWNKVTRLTDTSDPSFKSSSISDFSFKHENWLSRPAWYWQKVSNFEKLPEVADPWTAERTPFVFCEDISRFLLESEATEYSVSIDSPFVFRYLKKVSSVEYRPEFLLAI